MADSAAERGLATSQLVAALAVVAVLSILVGVAVGGYVLATDPPEPREEPTDFTGVSELYDDRIVYRFIPNHTETQEYEVSYTVEKNESTLSSVENKTVELSSTEPLVVSVTNRTETSEYVLDITIEDEAGRTAYDARIVVAGQRTDDETTAGVSPAVQSETVQRRRPELVERLP